MQIIYHIGAACTDDDRLLKTLIRNVDVFAKEAIAVPGPGKYRRLLRETIQNLNGATPAIETREILLDAILDDASADRVILSNASFICIPDRIFEGGSFYQLAAAKAQGFVSLFPQDQIEIYMAIRNPATFVPAAFALAKQKDFDKFRNSIPLEALRWSDVIGRIRAATPQVPMTVWCNEDTPLLWAQLVREISGVDPLTKIQGGFDLMSAIMAPEGMKRFLSYIKANPPQTENQKRRIMAAFMDKFALEDQVEEEVDLPGWTEDVMDQLTDLYEEDVEVIRSMPGVNLITP